MYTYYFERLEVFGNLRKFVNDIYSQTTKFPKEEEYNLKSQLRRSAVSAMVNMAEGSARGTKKDQANFTTIAYSSLMEVLSLIMISLDQSYLDNESYADLRSKLAKISNQLNALRKAQLNGLKV